MDVRLHSFRGRVDLNWKRASILKTGEERHTVRVHDSGEIVRVRHMHIMGPFTPDFLEVVDVLTPILTYVCNKEAGRLEAISNLEREALQKAREEERKRKEDDDIRNAKREAYETLHDTLKVCRTLNIVDKLVDIRVFVAIGLRQSASPQNRHALAVRADQAFETTYADITKILNQEEAVNQADVDYVYDGYTDHLLSIAGVLKRESKYVVHRSELLQRVFSGWTLYTNEILYAPDGGKGTNLVRCYRDGLSVDVAAGRLHDYNENKRKWGAV